MQVNWPSGFGAVVALVVLILAIVFMVIGQLPLLVGVLIALLALSRLT